MVRESEDENSYLMAHFGCINMEFGDGSMAGWWWSGWTGKGVIDRSGGYGHTLEGGVM